MSIAWKPGYYRFLYKEQGTLDTMVQFMAMHQSIVESHATQGNDSMADMIVEVIAPFITFDGDPKNPNLLTQCSKLRFVTA